MPATIDAPLVVDANVLFGALLRDSTTRHLILHAELDLHTPAWLWREMARNHAFLLRKSKATPESFDLLVELMQDHIRSLPLAVLRPHMEEALQRTGHEDRHDAPYVAAALALGGGIWSHDKRLARKGGVPVWTTTDIVEARS